MPPQFGSIIKLLWTGKVVFGLLTKLVNGILNLVSLVDKTLKDILASET